MICVNKMWIRNYQGKLVFLNITKYHNEKELYAALWKIKFNVNIDDINFNEELISMINS
jgi:hypothetical protein